MICIVFASKVNGLALSSTSSSVESLVVSASIRVRVIIRVRVRVGGIFSVIFPENPKEIP